MFSKKRMSLFLITPERTKQVQLMFIALAAEAISSLKKIYNFLKKYIKYQNGLSSNLTDLFRGDKITIYQIIYIAIFTLLFTCTNS